VEPNESDPGVQRPHGRAMDARWKVRGRAKEGRGARSMGLHAWGRAEGGKAATALLAGHQEQMDNVHNR
jgi:hypothetical protein